MDSWLYKALLVVAIMFCFALFLLISALAYRVFVDVETCDCVEVPE